MRIKFIMGAAAVLAAGAMSLGMAVAPASAAPLTGSGVQLCNFQAPSLCMNGYDGNGGAVKGYPDTPGDAQNVDVAVNTASCDDGQVTGNCPFTSGLHLNDLFIGDSIVTITNHANQMTYRSNSAGEGVVEAAGGGDGQLWVEGPSLYGVVLVNVYASNELDEYDQYIFACTEGDGAQVALTTFDGDSTACGWQELGG